MDNGDNGDTTADANRPENWNADSTAMRALEDAYGAAIRAGTLHAHELRQRDPKLYEALSQFFSRNKAKGLLPIMFADIMQVCPEAKGGSKCPRRSAPPTADEALAIVLRQREAARKRQQRWRRGKALRRYEAEGDEGDAPLTNAPERPLMSPSPTPRKTRNPRG